MATILIADDNRYLREVLTEFFVNHLVIPARNGEEAVRMAGIHRPDIVILDIGMPVMNGLEACARIKTDPVLCDTPVVMLTGHGQMPEVEAALECRADWYFTKPFTPQWLVRKVEHLIENWKKNRPVTAPPAVAVTN